MKMIVVLRDVLTRFLSDWARSNKELCAIEKAKTIKIMTDFQISSKSTISQIAPTVTRKPKTETMIPEKASGRYFFRSYKTELQSPVKLYPPIVKVVSSSFISVSPKSPNRKTKIAIKALILNEAINEIKNTRLMLNCCVDGV